MKTQSKGAIESASDLEDDEQSRHAPMSTTAAAAATKTSIAMTVAVAVAMSK
jgi:hypothetical protein